MHLSIRLKLYLFYLFVLLSFVFINGPKFNSEIKFSFIIILIIIFSFKKPDIYIKNYTFYILISLLIIIKILIPKYYIYESHNILIQDQQIQELAKYTDKNYKELLINNLDEYYGYYDEISIDQLNDDRKISKFYSKIQNIKLTAFSLDNIFLSKKNYSRKIKNINFDSISTLKLGAINHKKYSMIKMKNFDKKYLPFFVKFDFSKNYNGSKLCWKGNLFIKYKSNDTDIINNKKIKCKKFDNFPKFVIISKFVDDVHLNLEKNITLQIIDFTFIVISILFFLILLYYFKFSYHNYSVLVLPLSILSCIVLIIIFDYTYLHNMNISRSGGDGLVLRSYARDITYFLSTGKFADFFKGVESVYNFTPGIRYFFSIQSLIFGEFLYGYVLITFLLPLIIFKILRKFLSNKISFILILSFLYIPIFERYGFGYFNYIRELVRSHSEVLGIVLFLLGYLFFLNKSKGKLYLFLSGFFLGITGIVRPDFLPAIFFFTLFFSYDLYRKKILFLLIFGLGLSIITWMPFHNYYYGNEIILTTKAQNIALKIHPIEYFYFFINFFYDLENFSSTERIINQLFGWNQFSDFHRLFVFLFVFYSLFTKLNSNTKMIILAALSQQSLLFIYHSGGRQSYFAWFLIFLSFIFILNDKKYLIFIKKRLPSWLKR